MGPPVPDLLFFTVAGVPGSVPVDVVGDDQLEVTEPPRYRGSYQLCLMGPVGVVVGQRRARSKTSTCRGVMEPSRNASSASG